ncbi:MAG: hypothetical protein JSR99_05480 [Proteobacteria bacterium]|nr:hypothetical protein [Pseudomonadota bacterium]
MITTRFIAAAFAATFVLSTGAAMAAERSPESIECSKQADAKGLHGKERKKFRSHCKHEMKKQVKK